MGTLSFVSTMSTCFLFLLRVRAVYNNSRTVTVLFGSLWLVGFGLYALDIILLHSGKNFLDIRTFHPHNLRRRAHFLQP